MQELGSYVLPGRVSDPRRGIEQAIYAEKLGLATVWISERVGTKEFGALAGAIGQATKNVKIAVGVTYLQTRHPLVLASTCSTLQALTNGRFMIGLGRGSRAWWSDIGLRQPNSRALIDHLDILRRLWAGEVITYDGPAGRYPRLALTDVPAVPSPPVILGATGPNSLKLAGKYFDGAILIGLLTPQAVAGMAAVIRESAATAGRDPSSVRVYATVIVAADLEPELSDAVVGGRAVQYLQAPVLGDLIARANGWDPAVLKKLREHPQFASLDGAPADRSYLRNELISASRILPNEWLSASTAIGTPADCARRILEYLTAGADEIVLHGCTPDRLQSTVEAFVEMRKTCGPAHPAIPS